MKGAAFLGRELILPVDDKALWIAYQAAKARGLPGRVPWVNMGTDWRLRYNVACALSRAAEAEPVNRKRYVVAAVEQLTLVAGDRSSEPPTRALVNAPKDPDFAPIKDTSQFKSWV